MAPLLARHAFGLAGPLEAQAVAHGRPRAARGGGAAPVAWADAAVPGAGRGAAPARGPAGGRPRPGSEASFFGGGPGHGGQAGRPAAGHGGPLPPEEEHRQAVAKREAEKAALRAQIQAQEDLYQQQRGVERHHSDTEEQIAQQKGATGARLTEGQEQLVQQKAQAQQLQHDAIIKEAEALKEKERLLKELQALEGEMHMRMRRPPMVSVEEEGGPATPSSAGPSRGMALRRRPWLEDLEAQAPQPVPRGPVVELSPPAAVVEHAPLGEVDDDFAEEDPSGADGFARGEAGDDDVEASCMFAAPIAPAVLRRRPLQRGVARARRWSGRSFL